MSCLLIDVEVLVSRTGLIKHLKDTVVFCFVSTLSIVMVSQALTFYSQRHRKDVSNFDRQFTSEGIELTPTDKLFMMNLDQNEFAGFSFLNPEFVQHV